MTHTNEHKVAPTPGATNYSISGGRAGGGGRFQSICSPLASLKSGKAGIDNRLTFINCLGASHAALFCTTLHSYCEDFSLRNTSGRATEGGGRGRQSNSNNPASRVGGHGTTNRAAFLAGSAWSSMLRLGLHSCSGADCISPLAVSCSSF